MSGVIYSLARLLGCTPAQALLSAAWCARLALAARHELRPGERREAASALRFLARQRDGGRRWR